MRVEADGLEGADIVRVAGVHRHMHVQVRLHLAVARTKHLLMCVRRLLVARQKAVLSLRRDAFRCTRHIFDRGK